MTAMGEVRLMHATCRSRVAAIAKDGLRAASEFADLGLEMRRGVVYCWLSREHDTFGAGLHGQDLVYVEVFVDQDRCVVADADIISIALMYSQGSGGKPRNPEASRLFAEAYRATAVPLSEYVAGMFFTPEVLVKGDIAPQSIRLAGDD